MRAPASMPPGRKLTLESAKEVAYKRGAQAILGAPGLQEKDGPFKPKRRKGPRPCKEYWKFPIQKNGERKSGTYYRKLWREKNGKFCKAISLAERRSNLGLDKHRGAPRK